MQTNSLGTKGHTLPSFSADANGPKMVGWMRLVLAISALLAIFIDPANLRGADGATRLVLSGYVLHSVALFMQSYLGDPRSQSRVTHWLDVLWYAAIIMYTGGLSSFFFFLFFFAILTSSFRWGFEEGARVTIAAAALHAACGLVSPTEPDLPRLLMRTAFLLTLGYMCAFWGERKLALRRQLDLLRDVSRLSNPRFGVDHTITSVLEKTMGFFNARTCMLVMRDREAGTYALRMIKKTQPMQSVSAEYVTHQVAAPLLAFSQDLLVAFNQRRWHGYPQRGGTLQLDGVTTRWIKRHDKKSDRVAELLATRSFISTPLSMRKSEGRIYVLSDDHGFTKGDALFLNHIVAQAFPVIDNIELLDRMVTEAARDERQRIALNLHDNAVQPYIGLNLALSALRNSATPGNPLIADLDKLTAMASQVIDDLRGYADTISMGLNQSEPVFLAMLRRQLAQIKEFYGIEIGISTEGPLNVSDRLTAEVLHLVREGLSNICKHTVAQRGCIKFYCTDGWFKIEIENEDAAQDSIPFIPRSITRRAAALGGHAHVKFTSGCNTSVHIEIPV